MHLSPYVQLPQQPYLFLDYPGLSLSGSLLPKLNLRSRCRVTMIGKVEVLFGVMDKEPEVTTVPLIRPDVPQTGVVHGDKWGTILRITLNTDVLAATGGFDSPL